MSYFQLSQVKDIRFGGPTVKMIENGPYHGIYRNIEIEFYGDNENMVLHGILISQEWRNREPVLEYQI